VSGIQHAGNNLLAIINDILDFSKIESQKMDIIAAQYQFASLINDVVSIIGMRLGEKPISFVTKIDGSLPGLLVGDEARVRQILLNLLTNAVKYTKEGSIVFSIYRKEADNPASAGEGGNEGRILLAFEVADTGMGIKQEDMGQLFGNFVQFDKSQNKNVEGTGLGLAISRNLCILMGGDIAVESVYGEGSVFTALIPQLVGDGAPMAPVDNPETKTVLIYENRPLYGESLVYTLEKLGVSCVVADGPDDLAVRLAGGPLPQFVFCAPTLADEARGALQNRRSGTPPSEEPALTLVAEYGQELRQDLPAIFMPLQPVAVANILNRQESGMVYQDSENPGVRFTAPDARALIVDDIEINLDVVEGLLSPYNIAIDRASGGAEAARLAQQNRYDLVLMDHMMPDMDGIEATAAIRAWEEAQHEKAVPIIALTANAISGMKELFLEKGFNDYISKPIEIAKLEEIMSRWIPSEKRIKTGGMRRETSGG
jgi:CheY-like chemotaxis protein